MFSVLIENPALVIGSLLFRLKQHNTVKEGMTTFPGKAPQLTCTASLESDDSRGPVIIHVNNSLHQQVKPISLNILD